MDISPTSSASSAITGKKAQDESAAPASDFQTFLTLLTAQMRNQDPLKPMESTEFVAQLASFSAVEQQIRSNDRLDGILELLAGGQAGGLAEWIGKEVRAPGKADFAGDPVEVEVTPVEGADKAILVVSNDFGEVVARQSVDAAAATATWTGTDDLGAAAAHGRYSFKLESYDGDALLGSQDGRVFGTVSEVRLAGGEPQLVLASGSVVPVAEVTGLR